MNGKKEEITVLYFQEGKSLTEISELVGVSISYISRILRKDARYANEKENRKADNLAQRRKKQKKLIYANRKNKIDLAYAVLLKQHEQDTKELSKTSKLGDFALRKWCSSVYKYNNQKKRYEFKCDGALKPNDFPSYIKA